MAAYNPPTKNLTIFDTLLFNPPDEGQGVDVAELSNYLLRYPNAQGTETFTDVDIGTASISTATTIPSVNVAGGMGVGGATNVTSLTSGTGAFTGITSSTLADPNGYATSATTLQATSSYVGISIYVPANNKIFIFPQVVSSAIGIYDIATNSFSSLTISPSRSFIKLVYAPSNGYIYAYDGRLAVSTADILVINPVGTPNVVETISLTKTGTTSNFAWDFGTYTSSNGRIVFIPREDQRILEIDTLDANTVRYYTPSVGAFSSLKFVGGIYSPITNKVYGIPFNNYYICTFDCATKEIIINAINTGITTGTQLWAYATLGVNGRIYFFQWTAANVMVLDTNTETISFPFSLGSITGISTSGILSTYNNKIYCAPNAVGNTNMFVIDGNTFTTVPFNITGFYPTLIANDGSIYGAGGSTGAVVKLQLNTGLTETTNITGGVGVGGAVNAGNEAKGGTGVSATTSFNLTGLSESLIVATPVTGINANTYTVGGQTWICSRSSINLSNEAFNAFDGIDTTFWSSNTNYNSTGDYVRTDSTTIVGVGSVLGDWLQIQLPYQIALTQYSFLQQSSFPTRMPRVFYIVGSNNGSTWNVVDYRSYANNSVGLTSLSNNLNNAILYNYYRIVINKIYTSGGSTNAELVEWNMLGTLAPTPATSKAQQLFTELTLQGSNNKVCLDIDDTLTFKNDNTTQLSAYRGREVMDNTYVAELTSGYRVVKQTGSIVANNVGTYSFDTGHIFYTLLGNLTKGQTLTGVYFYSSLAKLAGQCTLGLYKGNIIAPSAVATTGVLNRVLAGWNYIPFGSRITIDETTDYYVGLWCATASPNSQGLFLATTGDTFIDYGFNVFATLNYNGTTAYATCGTNYQYTTGTMEMWIRNVGTGATAGTYQFLGGVGGRYGLYLKGTTNTLIAYDWATSSDKPTTQNVNDSRWHHIALVFQTNNTNNGCKVYYDGVPILTFTISGTFAPSTTFSLGCEYYASPLLTTSFFSGYVDNVRMWSTLRSDSEILADYNKYISPTTTGLTGYWLFNEGTGASSVNEVSGGTAATLVGGYTWSSLTNTLNKRIMRSNGTQTSLVNPLSVDLIKLDYRLYMAVVDDIIENPNFISPVLTSNTSSSAITPTGWVKSSGTIYINNDVNWNYTRPYPVGLQMIGIPQTNSIYQNITLTIGEFAISYWVQNRPVVAVNPLRFDLTLIGGSTTTIATINPTNSWVLNTHNFSVATAGAYRITITGTGTTQSGVQGIRIYRRY